MAYSSNSRNRSTSELHPSRRGLYRDRSRGWLAGVCAGIADYTGLNRALVRFTVLMLAIPFSLSVSAAYLLMAFVLKVKPETLYRDGAEEQFWREVRVEPSRTTGDLAKKFERIERKLRQAEARVTSSSFRLRRAFKDLENGSKLKNG